MKFFLLKQKKKNKENTKNMGGLETPT